MKKVINCFLICFIGLAIILIIPILLVFVMDFLESKNVISCQYNTTILSVYGSLISGAITLIGVIMTLNYQNKETKIENTIKYKPILELFDVDNDNITCPMREVGFSLPFYGLVSDTDNQKKSDDFFELMNNNKQQFSLIIKNKGRGETYNAVLEEFYVKEVNWDDDRQLYPKVTSPQYVGEILQDGYFQIIVNLPTHLFVAEKLINKKWYELRAELNITYSDMFNRVKYQYNLHLIFEVIIEKFEEEQPYFYKEGYKFAKVDYILKGVLPQKNIYSEKDKEYIHEIYYTQNKFSSIPKKPKNKKLKTK